MGWINKIVMPACGHVEPSVREIDVASGSEWQCDGCGRISTLRYVWSEGLVGMDRRQEWVPESPREYQARWLKAERDYHARGREQYTYSFGGR